MDSRNVFVSGYSDGGSIARDLAFLPDVNFPVKGVISSAAGIRFEDLQQYPCPLNKNVMILHNSGDRHFKNFGAGVIVWWASCNACNLEAKMTEENGCFYYQACRDNAVTAYCEQPGRQEEIADFLQQALQQ